MLKTLKKAGNKRPIHIITQSPDQNANYKTNTDNKPKDKYKGSNVIFDNMLRARNSSQMDEFFTRGGHENSDVFYISQSYISLPRQSIRNNCDKLILFKQRDVQSMYYDIGANDMSNDKFKKMCHKDWSERFNYLCVDMTEKRKVNIVFSMKAKPYSLNAFPKAKLFNKINDVSNEKKSRFRILEQVNIISKSCKSSKVTK